MTTQQLSVRSGDADSRKLPGLTILAHPNVRRVGERTRLVDMLQEVVRVSRLEPAFEPVTGGRTASPIDDAFVSRQPLTIRTRAGTLELEAATAAGVSVAGVPLDGVRRITAAELADGVTIELGPRVALLLHELEPAGTRQPKLGLVGDSDAIEQLRVAISRIATLTAPVLIRGETGVGKELVARALHAASRRTGELVAVNVAAIPSTTASSALFGHVRGAFTGAQVDLPGHFREADGGTLFLDEIGEIPLDVQATLLRAIESGEIQPVGAPRGVPVDVRLIAATDRDLESAVSGGRFRDALLHRLTGFTLIVPPLRERRDDIARLLVHFLREELISVGREAILDDAERRRPWLPAALVAALARHAWPGNVRQLRNVVRQLAVHGRDAEELVLDAATRALIGLVPDAAPAQAELPGAPTSEQVLAALERHKYSVGAAATELGVSRAKMYTLAEKAGGIRTARDVAREEIVAALAAARNDVDAAAAKLRISPRALTLRMTELGIER